MRSLHRTMSRELRWARRPASTLPQMSVSMPRVLAEPAPRSRALKIIEAVTSQEASSTFHIRGADIALYCQGRAAAQVPSRFGRGAPSPWSISPRTRGLLPLAGSRGCLRVAVAGLRSTVAPSRDRSSPTTVSSARVSKRASSETCLDGSPTGDDTRKPAAGRCHGRVVPIALGACPTQGGTRDVTRSVDLPGPAREERQRYRR